jgi:hypothetical protein
VLELASFFIGFLRREGAFQPYDSTKEVNEEARKAGAALIKEGTTAGAKKKTLIFVNNRLEGNALGTISGMLETPA